MEHINHINENKGKQPSRSIHRLIVVIVIIAVIAVGAVLYNTVLPAQTPYISVPGDHRSIQAAIEAAGDGDEIVVEPGLYYEQIDFLGKDVVLRSTDPEDPEIVAETIIDGRRRGSVVTFQNGESDEAVLKGFTIAGGTGTRDTLVHDYKGEEYVEESYFGGGIYINGSSSPTITLNTIEDNAIEHDNSAGGGMAVLDHSRPRIISNTIKGNASFNGAGIYTWKASPVIEGNELHDNDARSYGGGMFIDFESSPDIRNNNFYDNRCTSGGAIAVFFADPVISGNTMNNNRSIWYGGGIALFDASPIIENNDISSNTARNHGGGLALAEGSNPDIINNTIMKNYTEESGGGMAVLEDSEPNIVDNIISENVVLFGGGGIYVRESSPTIDGNSIVDNIVQQDGGGIAIIKESSPLVVNNSIDENTAGRLGGGLAVGEDSTPVFQDNTISNNVAMASGGGFFVHQSNITLERNIISDNKARGELEDLPGSGGGVFLVASSTATISNNEFTGNTALELGGAVVAYDESEADLKENTFIANEAETGGAYIGFGEASIKTGDPDDNIYEDNIPEDIEKEEDDDNE